MIEGFLVGIGVSFATKLLTLLGGSVVSRALGKDIDRRIVDATLPTPGALLRRCSFSGHEGLLQVCRSKSSLMVDIASFFTFRHGF